jgi:hypothetical protein
VGLHDRLTDAESQPGTAEPRVPLPRSISAKKPFEHPRHIRRFNSNSRIFDRKFAPTANFGDWDVGHWRGIGRTGATFPTAMIHLIPRLQRFTARTSHGIDAA